MLSCDALSLGCGKTLSPAVLPFPPMQGEVAGCPLPGMWAQQARRPGCPHVRLQRHERVKSTAPSWSSDILSAPGAEALPFAWFPVLVQSVTP